MKKQNLTFMYNYYISALYIQCTIAPVQVKYTLFAAAPSPIRPPPPPPPTA